MQNFSYQAANDQYLQSIRDHMIRQSYGWLVDQKHPEPRHISIMRSAYRVAQNGEDCIKATLSGEGWDELFADQYEFADWREEFQVVGEPDELYQAAIGFVIGASRAWVVVREKITGVEMGTMVL